MKTKSRNRELVVKSSTKNLSEIRNFIMTAAEDFNLSEEDTGKIMLSVEEACTNIIKHAYKNNANGIITIKLNILPKQFEIIIEDNGTHFNPNDIPEPDLAEYHRQKRFGGLGMFLMKKLMDKVTYKTLSGGINTLKMIKTLS